MQLPTVVLPYFIYYLQRSLDLSNSLCNSKIFTQREMHEIAMPPLPHVHNCARLLALTTSSNMAETERNVKMDMFDESEFIPLVFSAMNILIQSDLDPSRENTTSRPFWTERSREMSTSRILQPSHLLSHMTLSLRAIFRKQSNHRVSSLTFFSDHHAPSIKPIAKPGSPSTSAGKFVKQHDFAHISSRPVRLNHSVG